MTRISENELESNGFRHLSGSDEDYCFNAAVREDDKERFTVAIRDDELVESEGMCPARWIKGNRFRQIGNIRKELFLALRDRFAERLKRDLQLPCEWETFVLFPESEQLLVIAEHFDEAFLWDCQENPYPLDQVPPPRELPNGDLDFAEPQDYLRAYERNQEKRCYTRQTAFGRSLYDDASQILERLWGTPPDQEYYGSKNLFETETLSCQLEPKRTTPTLVLYIARAPNGRYATGIDVNLNSSGFYSSPDVWNSRGYASRNDALQDAVNRARQWIEDTDEKSRVGIAALKWLKEREKELAQPELF